MMKQLAVVITASIALAACSSAPPAAQHDQIAVQNAKSSDADYDKYMQGMIDSDANVDSIADIEQDGKAN
jgi:PBP1b-binding outer membrane lipoprotein LpoB